MRLWHGMGGVVTEQGHFERHQLLLPPLSLWLLLLRRWKKGLGRWILGRFPKLTPSFPTPSEQRIVIREEVLSFSLEGRILPSPWLDLQITPRSSLCPRNSSVQSRTQTADLPIVDCFPGIRHRLDRMFRSQHSLYRYWHLDRPE